MLGISVMMSLKGQTKFPYANKEIKQGNFANAEKMINKLLEQQKLTQVEKYSLEFQIDKLERIRKDFDRSEEYVIKHLIKYYPNLNSKMLGKWEENKTLEMKIIDGKKKYFHNAVPNFFRVNKEAKARKEKMDGKKTDNLDIFLSKDLPAIIKESTKTGKRLVNPVKIKIDYTLTVEKDATPAGEVIRCWLPYPREGHKRQTNIKLLSVNSDNYIISPNDDYLQRTLYLEKTAKAGEPTVFNYSLEYTAYAKWYNLKPEDVKDYNKNSEVYKKYTME